MPQQSLRSRAALHLPNVLVGVLAILVAAGLQVGSTRYAQILHDFGDHRTAATIATVIVAALTFYVHKTPALARRRWLGLAVAAVGLILLHFSRSWLTRAIPDVVSCICYGISFGPVAWTIHCFLRPPAGHTEEDVHQDFLHKVGNCSDPKFNILFVHGIAGHHRTTWQSTPEEGGYWPEWVAQDFPDAQVYALHYNAALSHWLGRTMPLIDRGNNLLNLFTANGIFLLPSVFVVHSFGGLVLKQLWRSAHDQGRQDALKSIQAIVFLATPHHGSLLGYLNRIALLKMPARTTQTAQDLEHHNQILRDLDTYYANHPVPRNFVYFETQKTNLGSISAMVVDESSASLALAGVFPIGLTADHLTICKPSSPGHDIAVRIRHDLRQVHNLLLGQAARPDRFEIDNYQVKLAVEPTKMQDFQLGEGSNGRIVTCDNIATLDETVTFAAGNQLQSPYLLRYFTKRNGFIRFNTSHVNHATAEEKAEYEDYGVAVAFRFPPEAGQTYHLHMEIYKGFDEGQRSMARRLTANAYYKRVSFTLDLTAYAKAGYTFPKAPQLYLHFNYEISATNEPIGSLLPPHEPGPPVWVWELENIDKGVLNLIFDVTPPAVSRSELEPALARSTESMVHGEPELSPSSRLDDVFHPQKYSLGRGPLVPCRFHIMSPQYHRQFKWEKLADVLVEVLGGLPEEHRGKEPYLIPSGRARPLFWDANNLRTHKESMAKKRAATEAFISRYQNKELQGYWFTMRISTGEGIGVYCLDYDLALNDSLTPQEPGDRKV